MDERSDQDTAELPDDGAAPEHHAQDTIPAPTEFDPLLGTLIDERYLLLASLGEGGMGQVYQARHVLMDKPVAIKVLHAELAHLPDLTKRFEREAQSSSRLSDPHIITVTDFGRTAAGQHYLVMELLEGESLADRIDARGALPVPDALRLARQILKGLVHAHSQGVVHRDLKPENVMLVEHHGDETDFVKILDFGIAKLADGGSGESLTRSGVVFGTPKYLSPEQALGDEVDGRADLYAAGIILWEMLVGAPPFVGETAMDTMSLHLTGPVPRLADHGSFPRGLQEVIDRALAKKPAERFQEATEFLAALEAVDPAGPPERTGTARIAPIPDRGAPTGGTPKRSLAALVIPLVAALAVAAAMVDQLWFGFLDRNLWTDKAKLPEVDPGVREDRGLELARRQLADNRAAEAAETARELLQRNPASAGGHLLLGHARFLLGERAEAMDSYELALTADPELMQEFRLVEHLRTALDWDKSRDKAALLMARFGGDEMLRSLVEMSNSALFPPGKRASARAALRESGHERRIDWLSSLTADFNQLTRCKERLQVIAEMEATGDPGFLPLLREFKPETVRKGRRKVTTNPCIGQDVLRAIKTLEERQAGREQAAPDGTAPEPAAREQAAPEQVAP
jgi:tetratricopeptide (TPR) repeat protein